MLQNHHQDALNQWVGCLNTSNIPVFSRTVQQILKLTTSTSSSAAQLAYTILEDASLTARILRGANGSLLNPSGRAINTISRAVVMLGFDTVRRMAVSIAVIDQFLKGAPRKRLVEEMARSFHAATQAKAFATRQRDPDAEEVYIAALLHNIGEIAFWSSGDTATYALDAALLRPGITKAVAEKEVLGFQLEQLTASLSREWRVSNLLDASLTPSKATSPRANYIKYGWQIATCVEKGWVTRAFDQLLDQIAIAAHIPRKDLIRQIHAQAREAASITSSYGASHISALIPQP